MAVTKNLTFKYTKNEDRYVNPMMDSSGLFPLAEYAKSKIHTYQGNIAVEALREAPAEEEILMEFSKGLPGYSYKETLKYRLHEKMAFAASLRTARFPLPYVSRITDMINRILLESYARRELMVDTRSSLPYRIGASTMAGHVRWVGQPGGVSGGGAVLGYAGTGKSTAVAQACMHYPQTIIMHTEEVVEFPMITWLIVDCPPNSNLSGLLDAIGEAIDNALNILDHYYRDKVRAKNTLNKKLGIVCDLIEQFGIGLIVLDEIQHIDFDSNRAGSYDVLLTMVNKTHVGLLPVGTQEAYDKLFSGAYIRRRAGQMVNSNEYTKDKDYFRSITAWLFNYSIFEPRIKIGNDNLSNSLVDALYDESCGIIDQLIGIYEMMTYEYALRSEQGMKPKITAEYVHTICRRYYPGMKELLKRQSDPFAQDELTKMMRTADEMAEAEARRVKEASLKNKVTAASADGGLQAMTAVVDYCVTTILALFPAFSVKAVEDTVKNILLRKGSDDLTKQQIAQRALAALQRDDSRTPRSPKTRRILTVDDCSTAVTG